MPLIIAFVFLLVSLTPWAAEAATVGLHLRSLHADARVPENDNVGAYVVADNGWTVGFYRSSQSGAARKRFPGPDTLGSVDAAGNLHLPEWDFSTYGKPQPVRQIVYVGGTATLKQWSESVRLELTAGLLTGYAYMPMRVMPFAAPSAKLGPARLTVLPGIAGQSSTLHLSAELDF